MLIRIVLFLVVFGWLPLLYGIVLCTIFHISHGVSRKGVQTSHKGMDVAPARDVLSRLIGRRATEFDLVYNPDIGTLDTFQLESTDTGIRIKGNSIPALTLGINYYLKYFCNAHVSWSANQLFIPTPLPRISSPVRIAANEVYRYYQNVCTSSYSMVWWDWPRWEKEIDWMALNGINLPLAFTAQEAIWYRVYKKLNFTDNDINSYFSGPAFLAWNRMGNMQGFGGPLSTSWHKNRIELQHQILNRMRELGMTPVLPAFAGRVPSAFKTIFPNASVITGGHWGHFDPPYCCTSFLEPTDPLFTHIGGLFLEEYIKGFGTNHIYSADLFNELDPPTSDPKYLAQCGKAVFEALTSVDDKAIWLMQGWIFVNDPAFWKEEQARALLTSVPLGRLIILDLESELHPMFEKYHFYYGQPFIWNMLHNYGGVLGLYGAMDLVNKGPFECRNATNATGNMIGTGLTPEGIEKNEVMFELMNEMAWRKEPVDLDTWLTNFTIRRYGKENMDVIEGWRFLKRSVYNATAGYKNHGQYIIMRRPALNQVPYIWYDPNDVYQAWSSFQRASLDADIESQETFRYDFVDVGRQVCQVLFNLLYRQAVDAYAVKDIARLRNASSAILLHLDNMERLLATDSHFLLGSWIESAKRWAESDEEAQLFEYNARNQISLWGPTGQIMDYANKQWSGVISGYIKPRWDLFLTTLQTCLTRSLPFNRTDFNIKVLNLVEEPFTHNTTLLPTKPLGDSIIESRSLFSIYENELFKPGQHKIWKRWTNLEDTDAPWWIQSKR